LVSTFPATPACAPTPTQQEPKSSSGEQSAQAVWSEATLIIKIALLLWFIAFVVSLLVKGEKRSWMARLFIAGFCLILLGLFLKLISRVI
jgi:hypothetical protein